MTIILILIIIILLIVITCYIYLKNRIQRFSRTWFGTEDFFEGLKQRELELEETPKTPYGIDSLILPEIEKDFPNMNINEFKKIAEDSIITAFKSVEVQKIKVYDVNFHKTVINKYDREQSKCKIVFQTALGYKVNKNGEIKKREDRINTEFIYIYNYKNIESNESISLKCPNCGGPIQNLGVKRCSYCNSGIIDLVSKTWKLNDIKLVE